MINLTFAHFWLFIFFDQLRRSLLIKSQPSTLNRHCHVFNTHPVFNHWSLKITHWRSFSIIVCQIFDPYSCNFTVFLCGWNSSASAFTLCSWAGAVISHNNSNGCSCCIACSSTIFQLSAWLLTSPSLPRYTFVMIPRFHCSLLRSLPFMTTTSQILTTVSRITM